jgi:hypothetical protein
MGAGGFKLPTAVDIIPFVMLMLGQGLLSPARNTRVGVIISCVTGKVHSQLTPHDKLLEIGVFGSLE